MILDDIAASARRRVETAKRRVPLERIREQAAAKIDGAVGTTGARFRDALAAPGLSFICEVKKASPSKGVIAADFPYRAIAREYEAAGAAAISVLTEPEYFKGSDEYLREIAAAADIPVLRKDFVVDEYQLYEAKLLGASAVLLICALLDTRTLAVYLGVAHSLGLSALAEAHSEAEVASALEAGAGIVGINNRDLKTFAVDLNTTGRLRKLIPDGRLVVSESGIHTADDIRAIRGFGVDAVLVGESLMRSPDKTRSLSALREAAEG
ncbi:indole-3-glycerol phosphate synthase TrpC [Treponema endosymbiont of Eucomonympha sp.]|uniref:indole-3-glycerol phosphate synthase TrpC n=1 Tax=Treponema endosymbiont of Eucomonympha sp. TaxID=1580831 RepID=UPI000784A6C4|nr:indole-3-glycerol phosphate synthase TrpC [Treponema endosymbiont of Eucomonympha sp.]